MREATIDQIGTSSRISSGRNMVAWVGRQVSWKVWKSAWHRVQDPRVLVLSNFERGGVWGPSTAKILKYIEITWTLTETHVTPLDDLSLVSIFVHIFWLLVCIMTAVLQLLPISGVFYECISSSIDQDPSIRTRAINLGIRGQRRHYRLTDKTTSGEEHLYSSQDSQSTCDRYNYICINVCSIPNGKNTHHHKIYQQTNLSRGQTPTKPSVRCWTAARRNKMSVPTCAINFPRNPTVR